MIGTLLLYMLFSFLGWNCFFIIVILLTMFLWKKLFNRNGFMELMGSMMGYGSGVIIVGFLLYIMVKYFYTWLLF